MKTDDVGVGWGQRDVTSRLRVRARLFCRGPERIGMFAGDNKGERRGRVQSVWKFHSFLKPRGMGERDLKPHLRVGACLGGFDAGVAVDGTGGDSQR